MISWEAFWPSFTTALIGTLKVFAIGGAGFLLVRRQWLSTEGLQAIGLLVALLTLPCLIFYRFATQFDPAELPDWWKYALIGAAITAFGMLLGRLIALRHGDNDEATMLVGFQNAGFFVLPMLEALLPRQEYYRASLLLFVMVIPFNASLWLAGTWLLLKRRDIKWRTILTPPFVATVGSLLLYGLFHDVLHRWDGSLPIQVLFGDAGPGGKTGFMQQIGDLTVPLATISLGGSIAASMRNRMEYKRAALEVTAMKMVIYPLLGYFLLLWWLGPPQTPADNVIWVLMMLQFTAPPAINLNVFTQQHGYPTRLIPTACLLCYIACLFTVPFFLALIPR